MTTAIAIVGRSDSGKTGVIESLLPLLRRRGYHVATVKHAQEVVLPEEKDSTRHIRAGSEAALVVTGDAMLLTRPTQAPASVEEALRLLGNEYDLVLCEGFKSSSLPKIEVHRAAAGEPLSGLTSLVATITDEALPGRARQYSFEQLDEIADLIEEGFIKPQQDSLSLYVDGAPVKLTQFPRDMMHKGVLGMVSALKGGERVHHLEIFLKHGGCKE